MRQWLRNVACIAKPRGCRPVCKVGHIALHLRHVSRGEFHGVGQHSAALSLRPSPAVRHIVIEKAVNKTNLLLFDGRGHGYLHHTLNLAVASESSGDIDSRHHRLTARFYIDLTAVGLEFLAVKNYLDSRLLPELLGGVGLRGVGKTVFRNYPVHPREKLAALEILLIKHSACKNAGGIRERHLRSFIQKILQLVNIVLLGLKRKREVICRLIIPDLIFIAEFLWDSVVNKPVQILHAARQLCVEFVNIECDRHHTAAAEAAAVQLYLCTHIGAAAQKQHHQNTRKENKQFYLAGSMRFIIHKTMNSPLKWLFPLHGIL